MPLVQKFVELLTTSTFFSESILSRTTDTGMWKKEQARS